MARGDRFGDTGREAGSSGNPRPRPRPRPRSGDSAPQDAPTESSRRSARTPEASRTRPLETPVRGSRTRTRGGGGRGTPPPGRPPRRPNPERGARPSKWRRFLQIVGILLLLGIVAASITGWVVFKSLEKQVPDPSQRPRGRDQTTVILDRKNRQLAKVFAEQNRTDRKLEDIPVALKNGVISTEDQRFFEHKGVDPLGIARALLVDLTTGTAAQGGSTITQQYVKIAFVTPEKTLKRKILEAMLAYRIEKQYNKQQLLELYLNTIYFGHGAYGVEAASQVYFGKPVTKLDTAECAMIAGVIKSPGRYSPYLEPESAKLRRDTVLKQMVAMGFLSEAEGATAAASPVKVVGLKKTPAKAPYFVEWIKAAVTEKYGSEALNRGGLRVRTTLDLDLQKAAESAIKANLDRKDDPSAALVAIDPSTGEVLAMVGGRDFQTQQFNVATQGGRQPGSAFKPFVFVTALQEGISPERAYESKAMKLPIPGGQVWSVTGAAGGMLRLRKAMEKSVNSVFAQLILEVTPEKVVKTAESMGIETSITPVPAIALGGHDDGVTPLEMASAYGTLAYGGQHAVPFGLAEVKDSTGKLLFRRRPVLKKAIDPGIAYITTDVLKGVIVRGTGKAAAIGRPAAGKTGTTQKYRDAWFVGYTPDIVASVWVGYPAEQREMASVHGRKVTGGSFPAEIWADFMRAAHRGRPERSFKRPGGIKSLKVCSESGALPTEYCPSTVPAIVPRSLDASATCQIHLLPEKITVPKLIGLAKEQAIALLEKLKILFRIAEKDVPRVAPGVVASQTPPAGSVVVTGTVVTIVISNGGLTDPLPKPSFNFGPAAPAVGQTVAFDASPSTDNGEIVTYLWEFGDGAKASGKTTTHIFGTPGTYTVTLWITDDHEQTESVTKSVVVK